MRFDLVDMQLFLDVVEAGSITAGAARAHLALASASERIQGMETALGVPLLVRHARPVFQQLQRMRAELGDAWSLRQLVICMRSFDALPRHAQHLVEALRT